MAHDRGIRIHQYLDVAQSSVPGYLPTTYPDPLGPVPSIGVGSKYEEIRTDPSAVFQFRQLPVQPFWLVGYYQPKRDGWHCIRKSSLSRTGTLSQTVHVPDRPSDSHKKTGLVRSPSHETHTVASEETLAHSGDFGKDGPSTQISPSTSELVVG